jgi:hypothetical protein
MNCKKVGYENVNKLTTFRLCLDTSHFWFITKNAKLDMTRQVLKLFYTPAAYSQSDSKQGFAIFFFSITCVLREELVKPWNQFSKIQVVFSKAEKYLRKSVLSFVSFSPVSDERSERNTP